MPRRPKSFRRSAKRLPRALVAPCPVRGSRGRRPARRLSSGRTGLSQRGGLPVRNRPKATDRRNLPRICDAAFHPSDKLAEPDYARWSSIRRARHAGTGSGPRSSCRRLAVARNWAISPRPSSGLPDSPRSIPATLCWSKPVPAGRVRAGVRAAGRRLAGLGKTCSPNAASRTPRESPRPHSGWRKPGAFRRPANAAELDLGVAALESFLARFPEHPLAAKARLMIAKSRFPSTALRRRRGSAARFSRRRATGPRRRAARSTRTARPQLPAQLRFDERWPFSADFSWNIPPTNGGAGYSRR